MANKMERFTDEARQLFNRAEKFAEELEHALIEPEHILLAMTKSKGYEVYDILADNDIILEKLLPFVKSRIPKNPSNTQLELGADTKKMLEVSVDAARRKAHSKIDSTHLLSAFLIFKPQGIEAIFDHFQVDYHDILEALELYWAENPDAMSSVGIGYPLYIDNDIGCLEAILFPLGFRATKKKKNR